MEKKLAGIKRRLVSVLRRLAAEKRDELEGLKEEHAALARPDFLWHYLLQSFSTMGRAAGWYGLIGTPENYGRVTYEALAALTPEARITQVRQVCRDAGIRMPPKKADYILGCFERVKQLGGPEAAKAALLTQPGRDGKIRFLESFPGIGPKYARNIMMDVYHEDFRDSIALNARINGISESLGLSFPSYSTHEAFYLEVAKEAGLNGWELDRLLFNFRPEIETLLGIRGGTGLVPSEFSKPLPARWEGSYLMCNLLYARDAIQRAIGLYSDRNGSPTSHVLAELDITLQETGAAKSEFESLLKEHFQLVSEAGSGGGGSWGEGVCKHCGCSVKQGRCPYCDQVSRPLCPVHLGETDLNGRCPYCDQMSLAETRKETTS